MSDSGLIPSQGNSNTPSSTIWHLEDGTRERLGQIETFLENELGGGLSLDEQSALEDYQQQAAHLTDDQLVQSLWFIERELRKGIPLPEEVRNELLKLQAIIAEYWRRRSRWEIDGSAKAEVIEGRPWLLASPVPSTPKQLVQITDDMLPSDDDAVQEPPPPLIYYPSDPAAFHRKIGGMKRGRRFNILPKEDTGKNDQ